MRNRSTMSAYDELELAVADMRARFLAIGERIAGLLRTLAGHLDGRSNPSLRRAADQIADTQNRLKLQMGRLPRQPQQRYELMRSLLQAQKGALEQLRIIVEQHAGTEATGWADDVDDQRDWPTLPGNAGQPGREFAEAHFQRPPPKGLPPTAPAKAAPRRRPEAARRPRERSWLAMFSARVLALGAIIGAAAAGYAYFPFEDLLRNPAAATTASEAPRLSTATEPAEAQDTSNTRQQGLLRQREAIVRPQESDSPASDARPFPGLVVTLPGARERPAPRTDLSALPTQGLAPSTRGRPIAEANPIEEQARPTANTHKPAATQAEPEVVHVAAPPVRFVAVVSTHKEREAAIGAFIDLQQRYPGLLAQRRAEAQAIELADKGTWHRLIILPQGSRTHASGLCDQLHAAGYDRCWVKPY